MGFALALTRRRARGFNPGPPPAPHSRKRFFAMFPFKGLRA
jgi:hypothetical protein